MDNQKIGFDSKKYLELQSKEIKKRIAKFGKLYLEFGGKLFDDFHASRVLPGFVPDNKLQMLEQLKDAMIEIGIAGMTVSHVMGCGVQKGKPEYYRGVEIEPSLLPKIQVDIVVAEIPVEKVIETAKNVLYTGHIGDGKIFVYNVENVVKVRTGESGFDALQDVE